ncbi:hypothetical protein JCM10296v2_003420 [Rhodotorula toruloides]
MPLQNRPDRLGDRCWPIFDPLENAFGQNPCEVARLITDVCSPRAYYPLPPLDLEDGQTQYPTPNPGQANECTCSMGVYNLVQACAACQQLGTYNATLWSDWVANCTYSNINGGQIFPYTTPPGTAIPDWACANSASGSLSVGEIFRHAYGGSVNGTDRQSAATSSSSSTSATIPLTVPPSYTNAAASSSPTTTDNNQDDSGGVAVGTIVGIVVPIIAVLIILASMAAYFRKKQRGTVKRGQRLDSTTHLPPSAVYESADAASSTLAYSDHVMKQKATGTSVFVARSASGVTRASSRRSFATNSVSTGLPVNPFGRQASLYTTSTGFDTMTRSSEFDESGQSYIDEDDEDDSISPFSDIHRPAPSHLATRDNIHASPSLHHSLSTFTLSSSVHSPSLMSRDDGDARSVRTASTRAPPSSSGATYGGFDDDDDDEAASLSSARR